MKKLISLLLIAVMLLAMVSGCGSDIATETGASVAESEVLGATDEKIPEAAASEPIEISEEASEAEAQIPENADDYIDADDMYSAQKMGVEYSYPIAEPTTISIWNTLHTSLTDITDIAQYDYQDYVAEQTGISVKWTTVDQGAASDQIDLMIASGDYTDMIMNFSNSSYTLAAAYEDGVILDLSETIQEFSPNYYAITHADGNEDYVRDITDDEGHYLCYWMLQNTAVQTEGYWIRKDMLETAGYDGIPTTYDEVEKAMLAIRNSGAYPNLKAGLLVNSDSYAYYFSYGYGIPSTRTQYGLYHIDDTVYSCYTEDTQRDYISMLNRWYNEGILNEDFVSMDSNPMSAAVTEMITTDQCIIYSGWNNSAEGYKASSINADFEVVGIPDPVQNEGEITHYANASRLNTMHNCVVTSAAEDNGKLEACMRYADWWYTDTGVTLYNYGVEGKVWNWNEDNTERIYTELVTNDPDGYTVTTAWGRYAVYGNFIGYSNEWRSNWSYSGVELDAMETWTNHADNAYSMPLNFLSLTSDESNEIKNYISDVETYVDEKLAKFVNGDIDINDDGVWEEYTSTLESLGLNQIVSVYQEAYNRYMNRR